MSPRERVSLVAYRIEYLDFDYESDNTFADTWKASLDIAISLGSITAEQRFDIEAEDKNQRTLERLVQRIAEKRRWDAMTPEQQERQRFMRESFEAQNKVIQDLLYYQVLSTTYKWPLGQP